MAASSAGNNALFLLMADALGEPALAADPRFMTNDLRCRNRPAMVEAIEAITATKPIQHWIDRLNEAGVPCSPINTIDKLFDHPQLVARKMFIQVTGKNGRPVRTAGNPIRIGDIENDVSLPVPAPGLNQHREAILAELMADERAYAPSTGADDGAGPPPGDLDIYGPPPKRVAK